MKWWRGVLRITSITRWSRMPSSLSLTARRSRVRCEVMPSPLNADGGNGCTFTSGGLVGRLAARHAFVQRPHPAADLFQRLEAGQVDMDGRDRDITTAHSVEVRAGTGIVHIAGRA